MFESDTWSTVNPEYPSGPVETRQGEVETLAKESDRLAHQIDRLADHLKPVLRPEPPVAEAADPAPPMSALCMVRFRISHLADVVTKLIDRVDV